MFYNMINENRKIGRIISMDSLIRSNYKKLFYAFNEVDSIFSHRKFFILLLRVPDRLCGFHGL